MNFYQHREKFPNVFILMPYDDCKSVFTKNSPTKEVLRRVSVLAKSCYEGLCNHLNGAALNNVQVRVNYCIFVILNFVDFYRFCSRQTWKVSMQLYI